MKKLMLFIGLVILGLGAYSQDLRFTKGEVAPGKFLNGRDLESFITGNIRITDASGAQYSFVKAEFTLKNKEGKNIQLTVNTLVFSETQLRQILDNSRDGAAYTFNKIVVKDQSGKEIVLASAEFIYDPYNK